MSGQAMRNFMQRLNETVVTENELLLPGTKVEIPYKGRLVSGEIVRFDRKPNYTDAYVVYIGKYESVTVPVHNINIVEAKEQRGTLMQITKDMVDAVVIEPDLETKRQMLLDLIKDFRTDVTGKYRESQKVERMRNAEQMHAYAYNMLLHGENLSSARIKEDKKEKKGLASQLNEMVMADLNNPYELTIQLEEAEEKENLIQVLADKDIKFSKEELIDTNQIFYFDTEANLETANKVIEAWGWKTNLSEKKRKSKGKALSTMGGADSQGRHNNKIGGDYRKPRNTGVSANPGFFGEDVELDEGALPMTDDSGRMIHKHIFTVVHKLPIFKLVGRAKSNASYGSSQITSGVYKKDFALPGEQIHFMHQTMFIVNATSTHKMRLSPPPGAFERDGSYPDYALKGLVDKGVLTMKDPTHSFNSLINGIQADYQVDDSLKQYPDYTPGVLEDDVEDDYEPRVSGLGQRLEDMYYIGDEDEVEEDYIEKPDGPEDADYIEDLSPEDNEVEEGPSSFFHKMLRKTKQRH